MLGAMRTLALDYLFQELEGVRLPPEDLEKWYRELRRNSLGRLFPFLVEDTEAVNRIYMIEAPADFDFARLSVQEMKPDIAPYLPFVKPPGSQDAQVGPVIKRSYTKGKGAGPSGKILSSTLKSFKALAGSGKPWAPYFKEVVDILQREEVQLPDGSRLNWKSRSYTSLLEAVVQEIEDTKGVLITVKDAEGKLPAQRDEYVQYLMNEKLAGDRYVTEKAKAHQGGTCPLCQEEGAEIFPNALRGAGINFRNVDREGAFPGLDLSSAWKGYALCAACADLLYIYKNHVLKKTGPKKDIVPFTARIAGERALIVPFSTTDTGSRHKLLKDVIRYIRNIPTDVSADEIDLLDILKEEETLLNLTFLWVDLGQQMDNMRGVLTDVPPSRLKELSEFNQKAETLNHALFPKEPIEGGKFNFKPDLSLTALYSLFFHPGGKKTQNSNDSKKLFQVKRGIAAAVYHKTSIPDERFWDELMRTARSYWLQAISKTNGYWELLEEGRRKKGPYLTAAGWIKYVTWWLHYFRRLEVMKMDEQFFEPVMEDLKPYFGPESGINSDAKAYAFLMGVLYGKLLEVQGARGVNVGSNALAWLRRLTLKGKDLPELYVKTREKLLAYESEKSAKVRDIITEIGRLGVRLGDRIELDQTQTNYYLLLGQSMARTILKKDSEEGDDNGK